jgi:hypothetical protein
MKGKNIIRALVAAGILIWPSIEVYRLQVARGQVDAAQQLASSAQQKLAQAKQVELAARSKTPVKP